MVVQLEIDTTKAALAHSILGDVDPLVQAAPTTKAYFAYVMPFIPGTMWADKNVNVAAQIGRLLRKSYLGLDSRGIVDSFVIPRLQHILAKKNHGICGDREPRLWCRNVQGSTLGVFAFLSVAIVRGRDVILDKSAHVARAAWDALIPPHLHLFQHKIVTSM